MQTRDPIAIRMIEEAKTRGESQPSIFDQPASPPPQRVALPIVVIPPRFFGERLYVWTIRNLTTPKRILRVLLWTVRLPVRFNSLLRCLFGGFEKRIEYHERMFSCRECSDRVIHLALHRGLVSEKSYCGRCGCPPWYLSRLDVKNWFSGWRCPRRIHAGPYGDEPIREWLQAAGYDVDKIMHGSCPGCGGRNGRQGG